VKKIESAMRVCEAVSFASHDTKMQVGAVLMKKESGIIVNTGVNGFLRGAPDNLLPNYNKDKLEFMIHAEINLLANCIREGISAKDCIVVCTHSPCVDCTRLLWQAGITEVVCMHVHKTFKHVLTMKDLKADTKTTGKFTTINYSRRSI